MNATRNAPDGPVLTRDLSQARNDLTRYGYCLVADVLTGRALETARTRLLEQARAEVELGLAFEDAGPGQQVVDDFGRLDPQAFRAERGGVNQRVWMLVNKGQCFRNMVIHPLVDDLVGHLLGKQFLLSQLSANIAKPGGARMGLHTDQWWMPQPGRVEDMATPVSEISRAPEERSLTPDTSLGVMPPAVVNTMWMLSDFTADNGATEVVPGTHLAGAQPRPGDQSHYAIVQACAPAGSVMVFDGRLWHGTGDASRATTERLGVLATFCGPQFRQQENLTLGVDRAVLEDAPPKLLQRLGFVPWNAYGRLESPAEPRIAPEPRPLGELKPSR
jgi:ectoine hydroxylase-related dioxygenase (phytanoyl-CoA dioxygenase family)